MNDGQHLERTAHAALHACGPALSCSVLSCSALEHSLAMGPVAMEAEVILEAARAVSTVDVTRTIAGNGFNYAITFTQDRNNLDQIFAQDFWIRSPQGLP